MLNKIKDTELSMKKVVLLAFACAIVTAVILLIPALKNTSLHNMGVCFEFWFVPAIWIGISSKNAKDAAIKVFVFFLISQPLIYLLQVPFARDGWGIFRYYRYWFIWTILTIPGGALVWWGKVNQVVGVVATLLASAFLGAELVDHINDMINLGFPYQLLTCIFIVAEVVVIVLIYCPSGRLRLITMLLAMLAIVAAALLLFIQSCTRSITSGCMLDGGGVYTIVSADEGVTAEIANNILNVTTKKTGTYEVVVQNQDGKKVLHKITFSGGGLIECAEKDLD